MSWFELLYGWGGANAELCRTINGATPQSFDPLVQLLAAAGSFWAAPFVATALWIASKGKRLNIDARVAAHALIVFAIACGAALIAAALLKNAMALPRPSLALGDGVRLIGDADSLYSSPSGHATFSAMFAATFWRLATAKLRGLLAIYVLAVGWSRVAAGMHFPADILAGWVVGIACSALAWRWKPGPDKPIRPA